LIDVVLHLIYFLLVFLHILFLDGLEFSQKLFLQLHCDTLLHLLKFN